MIENQTIAKILGVPLARVETYWPKIKECLTAVLGAGYTDEVEIAALATIRIECPPFAPIHEYGTDLEHEKLYGGRKDLGNTHPGDGMHYAGRGFIQITGLLNYAHYGMLLGINLLDFPGDATDDDNPNKALQPDTAAAIFAAYFHERGCDVAARAGDWTKVRQHVNGGAYGHSNGLKPFLMYVQLLATAAGRPDLGTSAAEQYKAAGQQAKGASA